MVEKPIECVKCLAPLTQPETGRTRVYCGPVCRQTAAYEVKRLQRRLERLERDRTGMRSGRQWYGTPKQLEKEIALLDAEIAELETRLHALVAGEASSSAATSAW